MNSWIPWHYYIRGFALLLFWWLVISFFCEPVVLWLHLLCGQEYLQPGSQFFQMISACWSNLLLDIHTIWHSVDNCYMLHCLSHCLCPCPRLCCLFFLFFVCHEPVHRTGIWRYINSLLLFIQTHSLLLSLYSTTVANFYFPLVWS